MGGFMKKNLISFVMAAISLLSVFISGISAQTPENTLTISAAPEEPIEIEEEAPVGNEYSLEELNVATINPLNGNFMNAVWGKMTSDIDVWYLLHGYDIVHWDGEGGMFIPDDTVVSGIIATSDSNNNQMFTIALYPDL